MLAFETISRRRVLSAGAGLLGLDLSNALAAESGGLKAGFRADSVIFVFLFGGPSQLETFDMKPDAPEKIRGPFKPIQSRTSGLRICEHLPHLAAMSDRYSILRTMTHSYNDHSGAGHYLQTGKRWHVPIGGGFAPTPRDWPSMGSAIDMMDSRRAGGPVSPGRYFVVPNSLGRLQEAGQYRRPGEHAGWIGRAHNPITTTVDKKDLADNPYWRDCSDRELTFQIDGLAPGEGMAVDRLSGRVSVLDQIDRSRRAFDDRPSSDLNRFREKAMALMTSGSIREALDVRLENERVRDRYGRHLLGQSCLTARRLVEAGARYVTVHYDCVDGYSWDSHTHSKDVHNHLLPTFDQAMSALLADLEDRGMLKRTLVVAIGEMGRTPQANAQWGRGHWSTLFPALIAGAGTRRGEVFGQSDKDAAHPISMPVSPEDLAATIYHAMGHDPETRLTDQLGREVTLVDGGRVVGELFG